jgi:hypothetical protein
MVPSLLPSLVALLVAVAPAPPPAPDPPPLEATVEAPWVVKRVSADGQTLVLWARRGGCDPETSAAVTETPDSVEIRVRHAPPAPGGPCPANMIFDKLRVRLQEPISGRALVGQSLDEAPPALRVPRMVQLAAKDARFALRAQGLRPTGIRGGAVTWQAPWPGTAVRGTRPNKVYLSNPVPEPRPAVLGRLRFRTVAKGDGAASSLRDSSGLVVDRDARWRRIWRKLTGGDRGRPQIDFGRRRLLVVVQGRRPSGGHRIRIRRVDGLPDGIVVDVRELSPAPGCPAAGVLTSPYHVVSIPRVDRRVDFVRTQRVADCD